MSNYKPRRLSPKWLDDDCPDGVLAIYDHPDFADRYTVIYREVLTYGRREIMNYVSMSENPFHPQGVGMHGEFDAWQCRNYRAANGHRKCKWSALPERCKQLVRQDLAADAAA